MSCDDRNILIGENVRPTVVVHDCERTVLVAPAAQGPAGPPGVGEADISSDADNRLTVGTDGGLYVSDNLIPDPLNYYILAKG